MSTNGHDLAPDRIKWTPGDNLPCMLVKCGDVDTFNRHWHWVRDRLIAIRKKDKTVDSWHPTHLKNAILEGMQGRNSVELWFGITSEGVIDGFIITTVRVDPYVQLPAAWVIWLCWGNYELLDKLSPPFEAVAREREYPAIEFITGRKGWIVPKKAVRLGYILDRFVYRKEIQ